MIFRDDDIGVNTPLAEFREVHELFLGTKQIHSIGILAADIWENRSLWWYLCNTPNLEWCLHGWTHKHYSELPWTVFEAEALRSLKELSARVPTGFPPIQKFYPPWHEVTPAMKEVCKKLGLRLETRTRDQIVHSRDMFLLHYWAYIEANQFTDRRGKNNHRREKLIAAIKAADAGKYSTQAEMELDT